MSPRRFLLTLLLALPLTACEPRSPDGSGAVRDSAGIAIVENTTPAWSPEAAWTVPAEPVLDMGASEGDPDHEFFRVAGVTRLSNGTIVVANSGTQQLRYYAADGSLVRSVGRKGGGPGEFQMLMTMRGLAGDSVLTFDAMNRRLSVFDVAGGHVRDFGSSDPTNPVPLLVYGRLADGSYVAQLSNMRMGPAMFERKPGPARDSLYVLRLDTAGAPADTFGLFPGPRSEVKMIEFGNRSMPMPIMIPFSPTTSIAAGRDRVYIGVSDTWEVRVYEPGGTLSALIRRPHEPHTVTDADIAASRERLDKAIESQRNPLFEQFRDAYATVPYPETLPAFSELLVDRAGNLWVADATGQFDAPRRWSVFDRDGVWLGEVTTPARLQVQEIGDDYVLGNATDDLDVERVQLYRLVKPATM